MRRLGIHSFVWTGGQTQDGLEHALRKSAEHGYRTIEFAYLRPEKFDLDRLGQLARSLDVEIGVTMGLPLDKDISAEDPATVAAGEAMLADAVRAVRDIGGNKLGGILYSAHTKYNASRRSGAGTIRSRRSPRPPTSPPRRAWIWCWKWSTASRPTSSTRPPRG